jgi:hypothetical protein
MEFETVIGGKEKNSTVPFFLNSGGMWIYAYNS